MSVRRTLVATAVWLLPLSAWAQPAPKPEPAKPAPYDDSDDSAAKRPPPTAPPAADDQQRPEDSKAACVDAFTAAQRLRDVGKLVEAREELVFCSLQVCPELLRNQCGPWLEEVTQSIPTFVVAAKDTEGHDTTAVSVKIDDALAAKRLDGRPIMIDPGPHKLVFQHGAERPIEQSIVVREGEHNRRIEVDFSVFRPTWDTPVKDGGDVVSDDRPAVAAAPAKEIPVLVPIMFGVAGGTALLGIVMGSWALSTAESIDTACDGPASCAEVQDDIDRGKAIAHVSTGAFAVAGAAVVVAVTTLILSWPRKESASVTPLVGPGFAGLRGRF